MAAACCGESWLIMWNRISWKCSGTARSLGEYLDGTVSRRRRRAVEAHLRGCGACRRELESLRRTLALLSDLPRRELSDNFEAALRTRLEGMQPASRPARRGWLPLSALFSPWAPYLRAPWPSEARRWAPLGALAVVGGALAVWNIQPLHPELADHQQPSAFVRMVVREHQLTPGADMNSTVVNHNLGGDPLGDGDDE
jgi:anti-sigma factor RsiW